MAGFSWSWILSAIPRHALEECPFEFTPADESASNWVRYRNSPMDTPELRREAMAGYYASTTAMVAQIGRLFIELEAQDKLDDTLIVLTSDNGMRMGHHGLWGKENASFPINLLEESVKVPFIAAQVEGGAFSARFES